MNHGTSRAGFSILKKYTPFASRVLILRENNCNQWRNHISLLSSFFLVSIFTVHESHENGSMDSRQYNVLRLNVWFRLQWICYRKYSPEEILFFFFFNFWLQIRLSLYIGQARELSDSFSAAIQGSPNSGSLSDAVYVFFGYFQLSGIFHPLTSSNSPCPTSSACIHCLAWIPYALQWLFWLNRP